MNVYSIREEYELDISLLDRHFNHVNKLVAVYCDLDWSVSAILELRIKIE
jgi:hypothetical protein